MVTITISREAAEMLFSAAPPKDTLGKEGQELFEALEDALSNDPNEF
jgi:hypothetical protein